jgi:transposase InsO family protein
MKQTAVDYLYEKLWGIPKDKFTWQMILNEAKKKEKKQIINAYYEGDWMEGRASLDDAEQYYNETYEKK